MDQEENVLNRNGMSSENIRNTIARINQTNQETLTRNRNVRPIPGIGPIDYYRVWSQNDIIEEYPTSEMSLRQQKNNYIKNTTYDDLVKAHGFIKEDIDLRKEVTGGEILFSRVLENGGILFLEYLKKANGNIHNSMYDDITFEEFKNCIKIGYIYFDSFKEHTTVINDYEIGVELNFNRNGVINPSCDKIVKSNKGLEHFSCFYSGNVHTFYYNRKDLSSYDFLRIQHYPFFGHNEMIQEDITIINQSGNKFVDIQESYKVGCDLILLRLREYDRENRIDLRSPNTGSNAHRSKEKGSYLSHTIPFSCEIEAYGEKKKVAIVSNSMDTELGMSYDGSLTSEHLGYPIEIQTHILQGILGEQCVERLCTLLVDNDFKVDKTCGLHIHLDGKSLGITGKKIVNCIDKPTSLINLYLAYRIFDPVILSLLPSTRRNNHYCADFNMPSQHRDRTVRFNHLKESIELMDKVNNIREFEMYWYKTDDYALVDHYKGQRYTPTRYYGVNFHSLLKDDHLEIRYHSGTLNYEKILYWVDLHGKIVQKCADGTITKDMLKEIVSSNMNLETLTKTLFSLLELNKDTVEYLYDRQSKFKNAKASEEILINKTKKLGIA